MKREFFGTDVDQALQKASAKLGIPLADIKYASLDGVFGTSLTGDLVGIIVTYDPQVKASAEQAGPDLYSEIYELRGDACKFSSAILARVLGDLDMPADVEAIENEGQVVLTAEFSGEAPDMRRGDLRELRGSLQYLLNRVVGEGLDRELSFIIDFGGNLEKRSAMMQGLGQELKAKVVELNKSVQIGLMDSQDRRLMHTTLVEEKQVATYSRGEGRFRVMCIKPQKEPPQKKA
jgi:predicted RNA-binding protein Jag